MCEPEQYNIHAQDKLHNIHALDRNLNVVLIYTLSHSVTHGE